MEINGRGGEIRTPDPLLPKQMRYQAALHPVLFPNAYRSLKAQRQLCICYEQWVTGIGFASPNNLVATLLTQALAVACTCFPASHKLTGRA